MAVGRFCYGIAEHGNRCTIQWKDTPRAKLHFVLHGEKLHGEWSLVRMHGQAGEEGKTGC